MTMSENTAAGRNQLTSEEDRENMLLAEEPAHLENGIRTLPTVQADREYTSPSGCHVKMFFRKEHDPGIRKEIARLLEESRKMDKEIARASGMLNNPNFTSKAPPAKVEEEKAKLAKYQAVKQQIEEQLARYNQ